MSPAFPGKNSGEEETPRLRCRAGPPDVPAPSKKERILFFLGDRFFGWRCCSGVLGGRPPGTRKAGRILDGHVGQDFAVSKGVDAGRL